MMIGQVTVDDLFALIGRQTVEIELRRKEIELLKARIAQLEAEQDKQDANKNNGPSPSEVGEFEAAKLDSLRRT